MVYMARTPRLLLGTDTACTDVVLDGLHVLNTRTTNSLDKFPRNSYIWPIYSHNYEVGWVLGDSSVTMSHPNFPRRNTGTELLYLDKFRLHDYESV